jgi:hypothetical protein
VKTRIAVPALAVVLLVAGCGNGHKARRNAVTDYIQRVNAAQVSMRTQLLAVERAYRDFGRKGGPSIAKIEPRLARSETTIRGVGKRIEALKPPPDARKLHALLVRLVAQEAQVAHELVQLAQFSPRFSAALRPLGPAGTALRAAFKTATKAASQASALDAYASALGTVLKRLDSVQAPPAFEPALASQQSSLKRVRSTALELAAGLRSKTSRAGLPRLIQRFTNAGNASQSVGEQKTRIAAIEAYNARVTGLATLGHAIDAERARLEKALR